ncbi:MAG: methyltransferase domain-containing protein [Kiritimatiellae bacterium]|nr:methyltransferase domain-containing protein [Kiritimatiellia bacterium]
MENTDNNVLNNSDYSLPLRCEVRAVTHVLSTQAAKVKVGLDIGFTNPSVSQQFRSRGGYWMTVEPTPERQRIVEEVLGGDTVLCTGADGTLPFEDRQFDALVLAYGTLPARPRSEDAIRECHRVLKTGGVFVLTVASRKRFGLASFLGGGRRAAGESGWYTEKEIVDLLKPGFDVLGFTYTCRFWVQLVKQWTGRRREGWHGSANVWLRFLYGVAWILDIPLFWTRGYQMTVCVRRKGWRGQAMRVHSSSTPVSDAMLFNPKYGGNHISWDKFK